MRLVTWNVQGMAPRWRARRASMIEALRGLQPDVVALQECAWRLRHQSMQIGGPLGMRSYRAGTLGLVSRLPVRKEVRPLPAEARGGSKRALVADAGGVRIMVVHWPLDRRVRESHAEKVIAWARETDGPFVLCGDLNETAEQSPLVLLREAGFVDAWTRDGGESWPATKPRSRIDYILVHSAVRAQRVELVRADPPASDHLGLFAELVVDDRGRTA